jgi:hypothetical protein
MPSVPFLIGTLSPRCLKDSLTSGILIFQIICDTSRGCRSNPFPCQMSLHYICNIGVQFCFCIDLCECYLIRSAFCSSLILLRYKYQEFCTCKAQTVNDLILFQIWPPHPHLFVSLFRSEALDDGETSALAAKSYELCNAAANHITTIGKSWNSLFRLVS